MSDEEEFAQIAMAAIEASKAEATPAEAPPPEAPAPTEPETPKQPEAGAGAGQAAEPAAEVKTETPAEPTKEAPKQDWKAAAAAERAKQAARAKAREDQNSARRELEIAKAKLARYEAIEAKKETDPLAAAEEFGLNYDRLTKEYIKTLDKNPNQPPPEDKRRDEIFQRLEAKIQNLESKLAMKDRQQVLSAFEQEVETTLKTKADEFELTRTAEDDGRNLVKAIVGAHWRKTAVLDEQGRVIKPGEDLPTEEACKLAEEYFERKQLKRWAETKKFKALATPKPPPKPEEKKPATATLSASLRQGGGEHSSVSYGDETSELLAMVKRLEAQQGN